MFLTFVENVIITERIEKLRFFLQRSNFDGSQSLEEASTLITSYVLNKSKEISESFKRSQESCCFFKSFFPMENALECKDFKDLYKLKESDWMPNSISKAFGSKSFVQAKFFWPVINKQKEFFNALKSWENPRPSPPNKSTKRKRS